MNIKAVGNPDTTLCADLFGAAALSAADGPGSRVVLFFQGCCAGCEWCHSPHALPSMSPLLYRNDECVMCGCCAESCPADVHVFSDGEHKFNRKLCRKCGRCVEVCPRSAINKESGALYLPTRSVAVSALMEQLSSHLAIADGITLSGGEALQQTRAAVSLLSMCKQRNIHTAVETSGLLDTNCYSAAAPYVDAWLFGFRVVTSIDGEYKTARIAAALECIRNTRAVIIPRIPMIPGVANNMRTLNETNKLLKHIDANEVWLNPWNRFYSHYYTLSGIKPAFPIPTETEIERCELEIKEFFIQKGYKINVASNSA